MNKLEELHLDIIETNDIKCTDLTCSMTGSTHTYAVKSAEITTDVVIKFVEWVDNMGYTQVGNSFFKSLSDEKGKTTQELFEEFTNNHYGK